MIPELGQFALILGLSLALIQAILPLIGAQIGKPQWIALAKPAAWGQFTFVLISFLILTHAFISQDFSVAYVAQNSNSLLPVQYRISAVWGAHEGSLLLWITILSAWTVAVAAFSRSMPDAFVARVLGVMGLISVGFMLFTLLTSNPFLRHVPALLDGKDLNPLLQDPGLIFHPPMLYTGYVGFSVAFAFAIAALLEGRVDSRWVKWSRPWTNIAWAFLTLGIALGSWWAYYELGWGGWWFWDPVENASFMPWLAGTALIHSQAVSEKRGSFKTWTVLLSIAAFSLSLLGTFLVRSGVLVSVHAFTSDPARGYFILLFLAIVIGAALLLYAWRAPRMTSGASFQMWSRETLLLINNLFMMAATFTVLFGTLYPLLSQVFDWGKLSVGPPYFSALFIPLMSPIILLMAIAPFTAWRGDSLKKILLKTWIYAAIAVVLTLVAYLFVLEFSLRGLFGVAGALWVSLLSLKFLVERFRTTRRKFGPIPSIPRGAWAVALAHLGVGVFLLGVTMVETRGIEKDIRMLPGDTFEMNGYNFEFVGVERVQGPNYVADQGYFKVFSGGEQITEMRPEKRGYRSGGQIMTEAAIDPGLTRDIYVSLGEPLDENGAWAVRLYFKPFVRCIWLGALMMMFGAFIGATDRRYMTATAAQTSQAKDKDAAVAA